MDIKTMNNGVEIPALGLGTYLTPDGQATVDAVRWALQGGYRHIDAAMIYENEESVGEGMKASGVPREEFFLTTKLWNDDIRAGRTREAFEESCKRLGTDYIDLYLIHWPAEGFVEAWKIMEDLYKEGRIKAIGVSNCLQHHIEEIEAVATVPIAVNQIESHPYFNNQALADYCRKKGILVEAYSPLGSTGGKVLDDPVLGEIAVAHGKTPAQVVIRWHLQRGIVVIPKSTHQERILANLDVFDFKLTDEEMAEIQSMDRNEPTSPDPDNFDF